MSVCVLPSDKLADVLAESAGWLRSFACTPETSGHASQAQRIPPNDLACMQSLRAEVACAPSSMCLRGYGCTGSWNVCFCREEMRLLQGRACETSVGPDGAGSAVRLATLVIIESLTLSD